MAENAIEIVYVLISFHSRDVLCTLNRLFVRPDCCLFCPCLAAHYLAVYSVSRSLIKQRLTVILTATATSTMAA